MAGMNPYAAALAGTAPGGPAAPSPPGGPPIMGAPKPIANPLAPPPPSGIGAMGGGDAKGGARDRASTAILALRDIKADHPHLANDLDAMIAQIQTSAKNGAGDLGAPLGTPPNATPPTPSPPPLMGLPPMSGIAPSPVAGGAGPIAPPPVGGGM